MLFGKKKKSYANPRFQRSDFNKKLVRARGYKRNFKPRPESQFQVFLAKLGLGSKIAQIGAVAALLFLLYLTYIPNFLFIKDVTVQNAQPFVSDSVKATVQEYFQNEKSAWPQRNIIFLNKANLEKYVLEHNPAVLQIKSVKKRLWHGLIIAVEPRAERFVVLAKQQMYVVYNDGVVARQIPNGQDIPLGLFKINVGTDDEIKPGDQYLPSQVVAKINTVINDFQNKTGNILDYAEIPVAEQAQPLIPSTNPSGTSNQDQSASPAIQALPTNVKEVLNLEEIIFYAKRDPAAKDSSHDFRVLINPSTDDLDLTLAKTGELLKQLPADRLNNLYYIDMRFKDKSYVCLKNTACARSFYTPPALTSIVPQTALPEVPASPETKPKN